MPNATTREPPAAVREVHSTGEKRREEALRLLLATREGKPAGAIDLSNLSLAGEDLSGVALSGADLSGTDLSRADLSGARLFRVKLAGAVFFGSNLTDADLLGADLTGVDLSECVAHRARFAGTNLTEAKFFGADCREASFTKATLRHTDLRTANLCKAHLLDADMTGAELTRANLTEANLEGCRIPGAVFADADLRQARCRGIVGYDSTNWIGADIEGVDFCGAYLARRAIRDQNYLHEFRNQSRFNAALYWVWWATSDCGRSFTRWGLWTLFLMSLFAGLYNLVAVDFGDHPTFLSPLYFSVVTLTTLGYGDATPASATAQMLSMLEVTLGYVMLGGLLSIFANKMARRAD